MKSSSCCGVDDVFEGFGFSSSETTHTIYINVLISSIGCSISHGTHNNNTRFLKYVIQYSEQNECMVSMM